MNKTIEPRSITRQDLINYADNANSEMKRLQLIPREDRQNESTIYCEIDQSGNIFWSSIIIGGKVRV